MYYAFEHTKGFSVTTYLDCGEYPNGRPRTRDVQVGILHRFETKEGRDGFVECTNENKENRSKAVAIVGGKFPTGWKRAEAVDNDFWNTKS